jgi:hypothetical protein
MLHNWGKSAKMLCATPVDPSLQRVMRLVTGGSSNAMVQFVSKMVQRSTGAGAEDLLVLVLKIYWCWC